MRPIRVAIGHDYDIIIRGFEAAMGPYAAQVDVVDYRQYVPDQIDVLLQDPLMPLGHLRLVDLADLVIAGFPRLVAYSWDTQPDLVRRAMASGAVGYLSKTLSAPDMVAALDAIMCDHAPGLDPHARHAKPLRTDETSSLPGGELTHREREILALIGQGLSNQEIAARCHLSINSIKSYIRAGYRKIGVTTRPHAVLWTIDQNLVADPDVQRFA